MPAVPLHYLSGLTAPFARPTGTVVAGVFKQGNENGPFRHVAYDAEDGSVLINEGTAANGIRVGTEVTTRTSGGEEWRLIYEYDQQGNLTNYVVNDSGDTVMFYEGTDINRSINVNNYPMQATVIQ